MSEAEAYVAPWLAQAPERELMLAFCPASERRRVALWGALRQVLDDAAFGVSDPSIAQAKLGWWAEELAQGAAGEARHPLAREWFAQVGSASLSPPEWAALAQQLLALASDERAPQDAESLLRRLAGYGAVFARAEAAVFGGRVAPELLAIDHLVRRLAHPERLAQAWPLQLLARTQVVRDATMEPQAAALLRQALAQELGARLPSPNGAPRHRRLARALDARRLARWSNGKEAGSPTPLAGLWLLWRAARRP